MENQMENFFEKYDWKTILCEYPQAEKPFNIEEYYIG